MWARDYKYFPEKYPVNVNTKRKLIETESSVYACLFRHIHTHKKFQDGFIHNFIWLNDFPHRSAHTQNENRILKLFHGPGQIVKLFTALSQYTKDTD